MNLISDPYGLATFRNGKQAIYYFKPEWRGPKTAAVRIEHGVWINYAPDGSNLETDGMQVGRDWDIVKWEPRDVPKGHPPAEFCMHVGEGAGL
jgi:hypothetical protein